MSITLENLDEKTREYMLEEVEYDVSQGNLYMSKRMNTEGIQAYEELFKEAIKNYDDEWLAEQLRNRAYMKSHEQRNTRNGTTTAKVPSSAPETLAEGEFNRFYSRGLCCRAIEEGISEVEVYRGKSVSQPRPQSQAMLGRKLEAQSLLDDLRQSQGVEPALGLPPGPNSGLTIRLQ